MEMNSELNFMKTKENALLGAARVPLDSLYFPPRAEARVQNPKNEERLLEVFRNYRCERLDRQRRIPVTVSAIYLKSVVQISGLPPQSLFAAEPPFLNLPCETPVRALRGRHRWEAAKRYYLDPQDRWWTVTFYDEDGKL
jgi:uncharacterized protein DUF3723